MKKFLSILLAVFLAFSACSMVSFAEEPESTDVTEVVTDAPADSTDTPASPTDIKDSMYVKWMEDNLDFNNTELAIKTTSFTDGIESTFDMYIKDSKMAFNLPFKLGFFTLDVKLVLDVNSGEIKVYSPVCPFFYMDLSPDTMVDISDELSNIPMDYSNYFLEQTGYVTVDGTEYYTEKILDTESNYKTNCYFKDGELVRMEVIGYDTSSTIFEISHNVSDKDVSLPFYAFIDVTPLIDFFDSLLGLM